MSQLRLIYRLKLMRQSLKLFITGLFLLALAGCAKAPPGVAFDLPTKNKNGVCANSDYVGREVDGVKTQLIADGKTVRVLEPDSVMTMDFSANRINLVIDPDTMKITRVFCG